MKYEFELGTKLYYLGSDTEKDGHGEIIEQRNDFGIEQYLVELSDGRRIGCLRGEIIESRISEHYDVLFMMTEGSLEKIRADRSGAAMENAQCANSFSGCTEKDDHELVTVYYPEKKEDRRYLIPPRP